MRLAVDTPRTVYYRGEEIEGMIRAAYYYGAPLAGREIRYQLADERVTRPRPTTRAKSTSSCRPASSARRNSSS